MLVVGLCGGIGSGKTVASDHFSRLGVDVIDTDVIAREIVKPGKPALEALVDTFGRRILSANGSLDRAALREIAFSSADQKALLDNITHPAIRIETTKQIRDANPPYCIVVIPLLRKDSPFKALLDRIVVVTAAEETKITRVQKRSNLDREEVLRIMRSQISDAERLEFADDIIENNSSLENVYAQVEVLHRDYRSIAEQLL